MAGVQEEDTRDVRAGWPVMSLADAVAQLCRPGAPFEVETVSINGIATRTWKNQPKSLPALARAARAQFSASTFIVFENERVSYEGWFRAAATLAEELRSRGIARDDRVALAMRNLPEWLVTFFAVTSLGAIIVPLNAWWTSDELRYGLAHAGARLLICDDERWRRVAPHMAELPELRHVFVSRAETEIAGLRASALESVIGAPPAYEALPANDLPPVEIEPDDNATIFYTSGTSGKPKGALGTHRNILTSTLTAFFSIHRNALRRGETPPAPSPKTTLLGIPLFHVTASHSSLMPIMMTGGKLVLMRKWEPRTGLELIERERVTTAGGVPAIAWQIIEHPERKNFDLSSLETIAYGGAPSAPELVRRVHSDLAALPNNGWGMTETSAAVTTHGAEDYLNRPTSCGPPLPVSALKIMDIDGQTELPAGEVGELWAFGPQIVKGYWNDADATAQTFVKGWVRTGDLAKLDEEGFCFIVDRAKDIIIRGGENIYSSEVENVLYAHPAVTDAALVGIPHRTLGEEPAAVVHLAPGERVSEAELQRWVGERLAAFKVPVHIQFSDDTLPRNANGKILKSALRARFAS